jgi:hypothetical protein
MTPKNHLKRLDEALAGFPAEIRLSPPEIRIGVLVPDFGAMAETAIGMLEQEVEDDGLFAQLLAASRATDLVPGGAEFLFRTRHGDLADLHAANGPTGIPGSRTWQGIQDWVGFFANIAAGVVEYDPATPLGATGGEFATRFASGAIRVRDVVGTSNRGLFAARATGCVVHILQDLHAEFLVELGDESPATRFPASSDRRAANGSRKHDVDPRHAEILMGRSRTAIERLLDGNADLADLLPLQQEAPTSEPQGDPVARASVLARRRTLPFRSPGESVGR